MELNIRLSAIIVRKNHIFRLQCKLIDILLKPRGMVVISVGPLKLICLFILASFVGGAVKQPSGEIVAPCLIIMWRDNEHKRKMVIYLQGRKYRP